MNILLLTDRLPFAPSRGGLIRAHHILQHLTRHASVELLSLVRDHMEEAQVGGLPVRRVTVVRTTPWRNRVRSALLLPTSRPLTHTLHDSPGLDAALGEVVKNKPDVVLAFCSGVARLALTDHLKNVPLVVDMVDVDSADWRARSRTTHAPLGWVYSREARCLGEFESAIVAHARTTLVVNERAHDALVQKAPRADVRIVPNGIDVERFRSPHSPAPEARVMFCGVLNYEPNEVAAMRLVRSIWPAVRAERPDARLLIVGANPTARLRLAAGRDPSIELTGAVSDVRPYLWSAALFIAPLLTARGPQDQVLEALAAGLPVVTTTAVAQGLPDDARPGCVVADGVQDLASAVLSLVRRSATERRAFAAQADLSGMSWSRQLTALLPILAAAARRKPFIRLAS